MREMLTDTQIINRIQEQSLNVWVCSPGGSGSNLLTKYLQQVHGLRTRELIWMNHLCHFPVPLPVPVPTIYVFGDLPDIYRSNKKKRHIDAGTQHRKLTRGLRAGGTDTEFLQLVGRQFTCWTQSHLQNSVLFLRYDDLWTSTGRSLLGGYLGIEVRNFPARRSRESNTVGLPREVQMFLEDECDLVQHMSTFPSQIIVASLKKPFSGSERPSDRAEAREMCEKEIRASLEKALSLIKNIPE